MKILTRRGLYDKDRRLWRGPIAGKRRRVDPFIYNKDLEEFKEFHIASKYVCDGRIEVTFDEPEESKLNWRQKSKVCDIWLLKK